jgi:hypothetical protein
VYAIGWFYTNGTGYGIGDAAYPLMDYTQGLDTDGLMVIPYGMASNPLFSGQSRNSSGLWSNVLNTWLKITSPIDKAATWMDDHPAVALPLTAATILEGNEGALEKDEGVLEENAGVLEDKVATASNAITERLGEGWTSFESKTSDLALRSNDWTRRVRFDLTNSHGLAPHINIETWAMRNLYPGDQRMIRVPNSISNLGNIHIFPQ